MLDSVNLKQILFLDIETVPQFASFDEMPENLKKHWEKKSSFFRDSVQSPQETYNRAGIYAEFGKIICISAGAITGGAADMGFKIKSFFGSNEKTLLESFAAFVNSLEETKPVFLCAHNGKEFDYPYISRRMLINGIALPKAFDIAGKKPWEVQHIDTLELWKFGDYKHYTSLDLLAAVFDIPSPKQQIDGSMVAGVYYTENNLPKIVSYCESDVLAVAQLVMRYMNLPLIEGHRIKVTGQF
ncbi:MAG: 3'-5' exonuclease [Bacteroidales bacterium]|nr:3'-5' exonuclease [Bacteroidales bacterium]